MTRIYVDIGISFSFGVLLIYFLTKSISLLADLQDKFHSPSDPVPGQGEMIAIITLVSISLFLRMIFVSYEDIAKVAKIKAMNAGTQEWQTILTIEMIAEVFYTLSVFISVYLVYRMENAIALSHMYQPVTDKQD